MNKQIFISIFLALLVSFLTYLFILPVCATQDDAFVQYILGNGFGNAALKVTYYKYGFLFYESLFVWLYIHCKFFNCITAFYILLNFISAVIIIKTFLQKKITALNVTAICLYFLLFYIPLITQLSFTTVAAHCIAAGFFVIISDIIDEKGFSKKKFICLFLLFTLAVGLRVHVFFITFPIALPFIFLANKFNLKKYGLLFITTFFCIAIAIYVHEKNYEATIPNWKQVQQTTGILYNLGNEGYDIQRTGQSKNVFERYAYKMIANNFLYDDTLLNTGLLKNMKNETGVPYTASFTAFYWLVTDVKQYILLLCSGILLMMILLKKRKLKIVIIACTLIGFMTASILFIFLKLQERIWLPLFLIMYLIIYYGLAKAREVKWENTIKALAGLCLTIVVFLQIISIYRIQNANKYAIQQFTCANNYINRYPKTLFVEYKESYPFNGFPAFEMPYNYPINNVLFPFFFNTELKINTVKKFNPENADSSFLPLKNIVLVGQPDEDLLNYFYETRHMQFYFHHIYATECLILYKPSKH